MGFMSSRCFFSTVPNSIVYSNECSESRFKRNIFHSTAATDDWDPCNVLIRIGVSYDLCGRLLAEEVEQRIPEKLQSTVAGLHVALSREAAELRSIFDQCGGSYAGALNSHRDRQLRNKLAAVSISNHAFSCLSTISVL